MSITCCPPISELERMPIAQLTRLKERLGEEIVELQFQLAEKRCPGGLDFEANRGRISSALKQRIKWRKRVKVAVTNQNRSLYTEGEKAQRREWYAARSAALVDVLQLLRRLADEGVEFDPSEIALIQRVAALIAEEAQRRADQARREAAPVAAPPPAPSSFKPLGSLTVSVGELQTARGAR